MRTLISIIIVSLFITSACSNGDSDTFESNDGLNCGSEYCIGTTSNGRCSNACSNCPFASGEANPPTPTAGESCTVSDWEHDFTCTYVVPQNGWLCCGYSDTSGVISEYGNVSTEDLSGPCCTGSYNDADPNYVCNNGQWQMIN